MEGHESGFRRELLSRLPLAQAVLALFSHVLGEPFLDGLFERHRGRCYEDALRFPTLVHLVRDALLVHGGSARRSFLRAEEAGGLPVAVASAYAKLSRLPVALSEALLEEGARRLEALLPEGAAPPAPVPASLARFEVVAVDGKKAKRAAKRLKPCRGLPGKLPGPKLLVALPLRTGLPWAMAVAEDGERNDVPLVPALLPRARRGLDPARPVLWVADAQFCDLNLPGLFTQGGGHFLLRHTKKLGFHRDPARPAGQGADARGRPFVQEWGWVGSERDARRRYVRRVTLSRADAGEGEVAVVTDLTDAGAYPAGDLLEVYLLRWGIEQVFQQVTEVFGLGRLIGAGTRAMTFQAALCLLLYGMIQVAKAYAARAGGVEAGRVSGEQLFRDAADEMVAWAKAGDPAYAAARPTPPPPAPALRQRLAEWIGSRWTPRWLKAVNKNPRKKQPKARRSGAHTSVWRVLQAHQRC
jgi:hypothetical protein